MTMLSVEQRLARLEALLMVNETGNEKLEANQFFIAAITDIELPTEEESEDEPDAL